MSKKIISFSLWGKNPKYTIGAIKNSQLSKTIYPDWKCRFYCANDVPEKILQSLSQDSEVIKTGKSGNWKFTTERLLAIDDAEIVIFRDTDSRLNLREKAAVDAWLQGNKTIHVMRDHPYHGGFPILAGMWGLKKKGFKMSMASLLSLYSNSEQYHYDQIFLRDYIWRFFSEDVCCHDEIFIKNDFPTVRNGLEFVGEVFDEQDNNVTEHTLALKNYLEKQ